MLRELSAQAGCGHGVPVSEPLLSQQDRSHPLPEGGPARAASRPFPPVSGYCDQVTTIVGELHASDDFCKQSREAVLAF